MKHYDTRFAKVVTDLYGRDHILIEGVIVSLTGADEQSNEMVRVIVDGLRCNSELTVEMAGTSGSVLGQTVADLAYPLPGDQDHD